MSTKHICLPFASEAQYREYVDHPAQYRQYLLQILHQHPALFPEAMDQGFTFHDYYVSVKQDLVVRRIKVTTTGAVFTLRPSLVMPYMMARTDAVEKALYLRQWGVPFDALAYVFGRDAMFWYRAWLAFGRPSLLGTTVKDLAKIPTHRVADEKVTWVAGQEVYVPTTVGAGCFLGVSVVATADTTTLKAGYGEFAREAQALMPDYHPHLVCTDGWKATREAWRCLFPKITLVLCFLHSILKIKDRCTGALRHQVLERAWQVYQAATKRQFAQRLRRLGEWTQTHLSGAVAERVGKMCRRRVDFTPAYDGPQAHRTSNAVDRLLNYQDRLRTRAYEQMALRVLINSTLADTARKLGITEEMVEGILDRHVETEVNWDEYAHLGLIGIDEVALKKGHRDYVAIVTTQLEGGGIGVLGVLADRKKEAIKAFLASIPESLQRTIGWVCTDMHEGYVRAVEEELPWAKVIVDRFHVAKAYRECADEARKKELRALKKSMSAEEYAEVKGVMWPFRKKPEDLEPDEKPLLERVFTQSPALAQAYKLREELTTIFEREYTKAGAKWAIRAWCKRVQASGLHYFDSFLTTLERWIDEITNYFDDRQTSGFVEGFNNRFKVLKRRCYGIFDVRRIFQRLHLDLEGYRLFGAT